MASWFRPLGAVLFSDAVLDARRPPGGSAGTFPARSMIHNSLLALALLVPAVLPLVACSEGDPTPNAPGLDVSGLWAGNFTSDDGTSTGPIQLALFQNQDQLAGNGEWSQAPCLVPGSLSGSVNATSISASMGMVGGTISFSGHATNEQLGGTYSFVGSGECPSHNGTWLITKLAEPVNITGNYSGTWTGGTPPSGGELTASLVQVDEDVGGAFFFAGTGCPIGPEFAGTLDGFELEGVATTPSSTGTADIRGTIGHETITGAWHVTSGACLGQSGAFRLDLNSALQALPGWSLGPIEFEPVQRDGKLEVRAKARGH